MYFLLNGKTLFGPKKIEIFVFFYLKFHNFQFWVLCKSDMMNYAADNRKGIGRVFLLLTDKSLKGNVENRVCNLKLLKLNRILDWV